MARRQNGVVVESIDQFGIGKGRTEYRELLTRAQNARRPAGTPEHPAKLDADLALLVAGAGDRATYGVSSVRLLS